MNLQGDKMDCKQSKILLDAFVDNELDIANSMEVERHLNDCDGCKADYRNLQTLRNVFKDESLYFTPPQGLKEKIARSIKDSQPQRISIRSRVLSWQGASAVLALTNIILVLTVLFRGTPSEEEQVTEQIVNNHMRSLVPNHLTDVQNSDQHTVKPWFNGKIDFSPPVVDLSSQGFNLVGGRLDYISGQPVAVIVYQRKSHFINMFFWFSDRKEDVSKKVSVTRGYNLIHWTKGNRNYWAVSDINLTELDEFASRIQESQ
jgi:anti-sigma factor RsiW